MTVDRSPWGITRAQRTEPGKVQAAQIEEMARQQQERPARADKRRRQAVRLRQPRTPTLWDKKRTRSPNGVQKPYDPETAWALHITRTYGLSAEDYYAMHDRQNGLCAICGQPEHLRGGRVKGGSKVMRLAIDHDHDTGKVRALLCAKCNTGIGSLNHDIGLLKNALAYLQSHAATKPSGRKG